MAGFKDVSVAILAGGSGTRLRPIISERQKVAALVGGKPFITLLLDRLVSAGIRRVVLCTGYRSQDVRSVVGESYRGVQIVYSHEDVPLGTGGALRLALPVLLSDPVLIFNGDSICETSLEAFWDFHQREATNVSLLLVRSQNTSASGRVEVDQDGRITAFAEKDQDGPGWINAGIYLIKRDLLRQIPPEKTISMEKDVFPNWIGQGMRGYRSDGRFLDIGTPSSYREADGFFERG